MSGSALAKGTLRGGKPAKATKRDVQKPLPAASKSAPSFSQRQIYSNIRRAPDTPGPDGKDDKDSSGFSGERDSLADTPDLGDGSEDVHGDSASSGTLFDPASPDPARPRTSHGCGYESSDADAAPAQKRGKAPPPLNGAAMAGRAAFARHPEGRFPVRSSSRASRQGFPLTRPLPLFLHSKPRFSDFSGCENHGTETSRTGTGDAPRRGKTEPAVPAGEALPSMTDFFGPGHKTAAATTKPVERDDKTASAEDGPAPRRTPSQRSTATRKPAPRSARKSPFASPVKLFKAAWKRTEDRRLAERRERVAMKQTMAQADAARWAEKNRAASPISSAAFARPGPRGADKAGRVLGGMPSPVDAEMPTFVPPTDKANRVLGGMYTMIDQAKQNELEKARMAKRAMISKELIGRPRDEGNVFFADLFDPDTQQQQGGYVSARLPTKQQVVAEAEDAKRETTFGDFINHHKRGADGKPPSDPALPPKLAKHAAGNPLLHQKDKGSGSSSAHSKTARSNGTPSASTSSSYQHHHQHLLPHHLPASANSLLNKLTGSPARPKSNDSDLSFACQGEVPLAAPSPRIPPRTAGRAVLNCLNCGSSKVPEGLMLCQPCKSLGESLTGLRPSREYERPLLDSGPDHSGLGAYECARETNTAIPYPTAGERAGDRPVRVAPIPGAAPSIPSPAPKTVRCVHCGNGGASPKWLLCETCKYFEDFPIPDEFLLSPDDVAVDADPPPLRLGSKEQARRQTLLKGSESASAAQTTRPHMTQQRWQQDQKDSLYVEPPLSIPRKKVAGRVEKPGAGKRDSRPLSPIGVDISALTGPSPRASSIYSVHPALKRRPVPQTQHREKADRRRSGEYSDPGNPFGAGEEAGNLWLTWEQERKGEEPRFSSYKGFAEPHSVRRASSVKEWNSSNPSTSSSSRGSSKPANGGYSVFPRSARERKDVPPPPPVPNEDPYEKMDPHGVMRKSWWRDNYNAKHGAPGASPTKLSAKVQNSAGHAKKQQQKVAKDPTDDFRNTKFYNYWDEILK